MKKTIVALMMLLLVGPVYAAGTKAALDSGTMTYTMSYMKVNGDRLEVSSYEEGKATVLGDQVKLERHILEAELPDFFDSSGKKQTLAKKTVNVITPESIVKYTEGSKAYTRLMQPSDVHVMGRTLIEPEKNGLFTKVTCSDYVQIANNSVPQVIEILTEDTQKGFKSFCSLRRTFERRPVSAEEVAMDPDLEWLTYERQAGGNMKLIAKSDGAAKRTVTKVPEAIQSTGIETSSTGQSHQMIPLDIHQPDGEPDGTFTNGWACDWGGEPHGGWSYHLCCWGGCFPGIEYAWYLTYYDCHYEGWPYSDECDYWDVQCYTYWPQCNTTPIPICQVFGPPGYCIVDGMYWFDYDCCCCAIED